MAALKQQEIENFRALLPVATHDRVAAGLGTLSTGMRLYARYAFESGALNNDQHADLLRRAEAAANGGNDPVAP